VSTTSALLLSVLAEVPVDPDAATAQRWARAELADPVYHQSPSLLELLLDWLWEQLAQAQQALTAFDARTAAVLAAAGVLLAGVVALVVAGPVGRARRGRRASVDVFGDDARSAAELRASADAAASAGDWAAAVLDRFRAILRSLEDRTLLDPRPGRTAHEATEVAGGRLPQHAAELRRAGRLFDDVCYGDTVPDAADDASLRELDTSLRTARPVPLAPMVDA